LSTSFPELKTHNRRASGFRIFRKTLRTGSSWSSGAPSTIRAAKHSDDLQWRDAATLDKAVEMKVSFYAAHLKGWA
jgi:hypothetical protein